MYRIKRRMTSSSNHLIVLVAALMTIGVLMVYSAGASLASPTSVQEFYKDPALRQMIFAPLGLLALLLAAMLPYRWLRMRDRFLRSPAVWLLVVSLALLIVVLVPGIGQQVKGARRWIRWSPGGVGLGVQPSEIAKLGLVVFLAAALSWYRLDVRRFWRGLLPVALIIGLVCGLIGKEDLGTMVLVGVVAGGLLLAGGAKLWHLGLLAVPALAGMVDLIAGSPYRIKRIMGFLDPYTDPLGVGYHPIQSLISLAGGGWWGRGLGSSIQKYGYLPEAKTDFVFAVICEELGIVGGCVVIGLFLLWLWQAGVVISRTRDLFGRLLGLGVTLTIGLQAAMNIAVVTVSVPTKGISLPFVSAGGSGLILAALGAGLLASIARRREIIIEPEWLADGAEAEDEADAMPAVGHG